MFVLRLSFYKSFTFRLEYIMIVTSYLLQVTTTMSNVLFTLLLFRHLCHVAMIFERGFGAARKASSDFCVLN